MAQVHRTEAALTGNRFALAAAIVSFLALTGYPNWHGGWSLGSRYLLALVFFTAAALPFALGSRLSRGFFAAAVVFSSGTHLLLTLSWPHFPLDLSFPPANGSWWFLEHRWVAPNLGTLAGVEAAASLLLPLAAAGAALGLSLRAARPFAFTASLALLIGLAPLVVLCLRPPALGYGGRLWRAAIYGAYSGLDPNRENLRSVAIAAKTPDERRQAARAWKVYGPRR